MANDVLGKLKLPAIGLLVIGILNGLTAVLILFLAVARLAGISEGRSVPTDEARRIGFYTWVFISNGSALLTLLAAPLVIFGAIQMMKGRKYGFSKTAAILTVIPFTSCCFLIGVPFGIWSLMVLRKPDVKAFFNGEMTSQRFSPPPPQS